jgi:hypothetical protein
MKWVAAIALFLAAIACGESGTDSPDANSSTRGISGTVSGAVAAGVTITLSGSGASDRTVVTSEDGTYLFDGLANGSYTVSAALDGYTFAGSPAHVILEDADAVRNFIAHAIVATYNISGTVSGAVAAGVTIT